MISIAGDSVSYLGKTTSENSSAVSFDIIGRDKADGGIMTQHRQMARRRDGIKMEAAKPGGVVIIGAASAGAACAH